MRKRDIDKLKQLAALLKWATRDIETMIWYTEQDAETKGYSWLTSALSNVSISLIEIKKHYDLIAKSNVGWILDDYGIKLRRMRHVPWSRIVKIMKEQGIYEEEKVSEGKKVYRVNGTMTISCFVDVEAETEEEAIELAGNAEIMGLCHQCANGKDGEWSTSGELDGQPDIDGAEEL